MEYLEGLNGVAKHHVRSTCCQLDFQLRSNLAALDMSMLIHLRASVLRIKASLTSWLGLRIMVPIVLLKKLSRVLVLQVCETAAVLLRILCSKSLSLTSVVR